MQDTGEPFFFKNLMCVTGQGESVESETNTCTCKMGRTFKEDLYIVSP